MIAPAVMVAVVEAYVAAFADGDPEAIVGLFSEGASVEDPVGATPIVGKLSLDGPVRTSGVSAAFAFTVTVPADQAVTRIAVVDVFDFDPDGRIRSMRAYWDEQNVMLATEKAIDDALNA